MLSRTLGMFFFFLILNILNVFLKKLATCVYTTNGHNGTTNRLPHHHTTSPLVTPPPPPLTPPPPPPRRCILMCRHLQTMTTATNDEQLGGLETHLSRAFGMFLLFLLFH